MDVTIAAAVFWGVGLAFPSETNAGAWVNRRGGSGDGWDNHAGGCAGDRNVRARWLCGIELKR